MTLRHNTQIDHNPLPPYCRRLGFDRSPAMSYMGFKHALQDYSRRDHQYARERKHGFTTVRLDRYLSMAVIHTDSRCFYFRDRPFMTIDEDNTALTFDFLHLDRPGTVVRHINRIAKAMGINLAFNQDTRAYGEKGVQAVYQRPARSPSAVPAQPIFMPYHRMTSLEILTVAPRRMIIGPVIENPTPTQICADFWRESQGAWKGLGARIQDEWRASDAPIAANTLSLDDLV